MDPVSLIHSVVMVASTLYSIKKSIVANKNRCYRLIDRIKVIIDALEKLEKAQAKDLSIAGLTNLRIVVEEALNLANKCSQSGLIQKIISSGYYAFEFDTINTKIGETIGDLQLSIKAQELLSSSQDKKDKLEDVDSLNRISEDIKKEFANLKASLASNAESNYVSIPLEDIKVGQQIGKGGFGVVYSGEWNYQKVAIKEMPTGVDSFKRELSIMMKLKSCEFIIRFFGVVEEGQKSMIIMELAENGSLYDVLHGTKSISVDQKLNICKKIAFGIDYMHKLGILHRDIKSPNILIDSGYQPKISDFGMSKASLSSIKTYGNQISNTGTKRWMAPELLMAKRYTEKADIYSIGIVYWEIWTHRMPFEDHDDASVADAVKSGLREDFDDVPTAVSPIITECWDQNPAKRPTSSYLVSLIYDVEASDIDTSSEVRKFALNSGFIRLLDSESLKSITKEELMTGKFPHLNEKYEITSEEYILIKRCRKNELLELPDLGKLSKKDIKSMETLALASGVSKLVNIKGTTPRQLLKMSPKKMESQHGITKDDYEKINKAMA